MGAVVVGSVVMGVVSSEAGTLRKVTSGGSNGVYLVCQWFFLLPELSWGRGIDVPIG